MVFPMHAAFALLIIVFKATDSFAKQGCFQYIWEQSNFQDMSTFLSDGSDH